MSTDNIAALAAALAEVEGSPESYGAFNYPDRARLLLERAAKFGFREGGVTEGAVRTAWDAYCEYLKRAEEHNPESRTLTVIEFLWRELNRLEAS